MKKLLALLLLSPLAFADEVASDLIGKTWIESSAKDTEDSGHTFRFIEDGRFFAISDTVDDKGLLVWDGAYKISSENKSFSIYSDDLECGYWVYKLGSFYRLENYSRNYTNICPDLLIKESPSELK